MAPQFQSSFIPKETTMEKTHAYSSGSSFLNSVARLVLILVVVVTIGVFAYKFIVERSVSSLQLELVAAEENIDKTTIREMSDFSDKLSVAKTIMARHQAVSHFLSLLGSSTVSSLEFNDFSYESLTDNTLMIRITGKARDYASLALQDAVLAQDKRIKSVKFSDLVLTEEGTVTFGLSAIVDPEISHYKVSNQVITVKTTSTTTEEDI